MDRYQKVERPKTESPINENEIRITSQGLVRNYINYALTLLQERHGREIVLKAMGQAISKTVAIAEIIKRRVPRLHQDTAISSVSITDVWEPIEEGLLPVEMTRQVSMIAITLSPKELDKNSPGYQAPTHVEQSQQTRPEYNYQQRQQPRQMQYNFQQQQQQQQPRQAQYNKYQQPQQPRQAQYNNYQQQQQPRQAQYNNYQQPRDSRAFYNAAGDDETYGRGRGRGGQGRGRGRGRGWNRGGNYGNYQENGGYSNWNQGGGQGGNWNYRGGYGGGRGGGGGGGRGYSYGRGGRGRMGGSNRLVDVGDHA